MMKCPFYYGMSDYSLRNDPFLQGCRMDLAQNAFLALHRDGLLRFDCLTGDVECLWIGRISSFYYVSHATIALYASNLKLQMCEVDILRVFSLAEEFGDVLVRGDEVEELVALVGRLPFPVKDSPGHVRTKIITLIQVYIGRVDLQSHAEKSDMYYYVYSAGRLLRCLFALSLGRSFCYAALKILDLCKMVSWRLWLSQCLLRQLVGVPEVILNRMERRALNSVGVERLTLYELGSVLGDQTLSTKVIRLVRLIPRYDLVSQFVPLSCLGIEVSLDVQFDFE